MHIVRLRHKLRPTANDEMPEAICTVRAQGYKAGPDWRIFESERELS
jgi:DNA-binding response OmpR family regulator